MTESLPQLGRYELLQRLATGGMGEIYLARTRGAGGFEKLVIIKKILPHLAERQEFITKFLDEGRTVVQLTHGNIVPVFDMGEENGEYFIAMEYVPGLDVRAILANLRKADERLSIAHALHIGAEVCKGLDYAHRKTDDQGRPLHIVHRDISPSNVLISREGEVKLIDFGIARAADKVAKTATGRIQGKCCYMSPEQARGKSLDARSDIFSTGLLIYEMLTLERPFDGRSDLESLELVRQCDISPPGVHRPAIPESIDRILQKALAQDPDDRYQNADALFVELQQALHHLGHTVTSHQLANALKPHFDDQIEPPSDSQPLDLDAALEQQLQAFDPDQSNPNTASLGLAWTATSASSTPVARPQGTDGNLIQSSPSPSSSSTLTDDSSSPNLYGRASVIVAVATAALFAILLLLEAIDTTEESATLDLESDPPGAQIILEGDALAGRSTPDTLTLNPGTHRIELQADGYEARQFRVDLDAGETRTLSPDDLRLTPAATPPRRFTIDASPSSTRLHIDGEAVGSLPIDLDLRPDESAELQFRHDDCRDYRTDLAGDRQRQRFFVELDCDEPDSNDVDAPTDQAPVQQADEPLPPIAISSDPADVDITWNDQHLGTTPLEVPRPDSTVDLVAHREGYVPLQKTLAPNELNEELILELEARPQGCLHFRALYPAHNRIAINDQWLDGRHMALRNHALPAGEHQITVHHPESDRRETFSVDIEPGDDCKVLTVWDED